jgi:hypothetical protein
MAIFARSPYIVTINETAQIETKLEIFLWNGNTTPIPASPAYTLSKKIPASNAPATYYDISPYVREYINHSQLQTITTSNANTPSTQWCWVGLKIYKKISTTFIQVGTTVTRKAYDGFTYYNNGYNYDLGRFHLDQGGYNYYIDGSGNTGHITIENIVGDSIKWTNLSTGASTTSSLGSSNVQDYPRVYNTYMNDGNLVEIINSGTTLWSATFRPKEECKYTPVRCDFVNKYGAWQTEWFYKASNTSISMENTEYNLMQSTYPNYSIQEGQRKMFNTNIKQQIKVNTDWVDETFSETIKQLMASERILLDKSPVKLNTKTTELFKSINNHMINYQLDFEYAYDIINSVN